MEEKLNFGKLRRDMVSDQIATRGVTDETVLKALLKVPREEFLPDDMKLSAYDDCPLPIGSNQTISQPFIVALMTCLAEPRRGDKILEIGTGSGYQSAILAEIGCEVFSIERIPELAERASRTLERLKYRVNSRTGDGTLGWRDFSPYKSIIVTAASPGIPDSLVEQIEEGGRIVIPVGSMFSQELIRGIKKAGKLTGENHGSCTFVPLKGKEGWKE